MTIYVPGSLVRTAKNFAIRAHTDCNQRYGDLPYVAHLADVASNAIAFSSLLHDDAERDLAVAAAWLHDVLEDTHTSYNDLLRGIGEFPDVLCKEVTEIVFAVTNNKGRTRSERADDAYYEGICNNIVAVYVKLCDRLANVQGDSMRSGYAKEHASFKWRLRADLYEPLWTEIERHLGIGQTP